MISKKKSVKIIKITFVIIMKVQNSILCCPLLLPQGFSKPPEVCKFSCHGVLLKSNSGKKIFPSFAKLVHILKHSVDSPFFAINKTNNAKA